MGSIVHGQRRVRIGAVRSRIGAVRSRIGAVRSRIGAVRSRIGAVRSLPPTARLLAVGTAALLMVWVIVSPPHPAAADAPGQYTVSDTPVTLSQPADALLGRMSPAA
ncbi:MAG TPA: hypothetical protein VI248_22545, partial [Kineosporiaceae bacterium]